MDPDQKLHGFPNFMEPTPNLQTRNPPTQTVMEKALHRFEESLKEAKSDQQEDQQKQQSKIQLERLRILSE